MPYDRRNRRDREKIAHRLKLYWPDGRVPTKAIDQFAEVYNSVYRKTHDEGRAIASGYAVAKRRNEVHPAIIPAGAAGAAVSTVGRALAVAVGRKLLIDLERVLSQCDCGKDHERALQAIRYALRVAAAKVGPSAPVAAKPAKLSRRNPLAAATLQARVGSSSAWHPEAAVGSGYESAQVGVNAAVMWTMMKDHIYSQGDRLFLAVREMLQNSRDAKARNIQITWTPNPEPIEVEDNSGYVRRVQTGTLVFADDGRGMDQKVFREKFMVLGESEKYGDTDALGGFGVAKAAILTASSQGWQWDIRTRNVHAYATAGGGYSIGEVPERIQGTVITIPNVIGGDETGYMRSPMGSGTPARRIEALVGASDLRGIIVTINGRPAPNFFENRRGMKTKQDEAFQKLDWGKFPVHIRSYRRDPPEGGAIIVRVKGLAQFAFAAPYNGVFERDTVLDFEIPKDIHPQSAGYPFKAGRDGFKTGGRAYDAFELMRDTLNASAVKQEKDLGEYEEIAPDSSDPRERKAEVQLAGMLDSVMTSKGYEAVLEDVVELSRELYASIDRAVRSDDRKSSVEVVQESEREEDSLRPQGDHEGIPGEGRLAEAPPSEITTFESTVLGLTDVQEMLLVLQAWIHKQLPTEDLSRLDIDLRNLRQGYGGVGNLQTIQDFTQKALKKAAPDVSQLVVAAFVSKLLTRLEALFPHEYQKKEIERRKKAGELNPFGGAACIFVSREHYDRFEYRDGERVPNTERSHAFRKRARKQDVMKLLTWWDFTVRAVLRALHASGTIAEAVNPGVGFVLDDQVLGLCRKDGAFVMINPEALEEVVKQFSDRAFIPAAYIHGIAAHEIAHAHQIQRYSNSDHDRNWSTDREAFAEQTLFLLPSIEEAGARLLKMKRRRTRAPRPKDDGKLLARIAELETALAESRLLLEEETRRQDAVLVDARALSSKLEQMVLLEEFRQWVLGNPELLASRGMTPSQFLESISTNNGFARMLEHVGRHRAQAQLSHMVAALGAPDEGEAREAFHAACGCSAAGAQYLAAQGAAPLPEFAVGPVEHAEARMVSAQSILFHGTTPDGLRRIAREGLRPRDESGGYSVHRTKTTDAIFLTDNILVALYYTAAGDADAPVIILEVDSSGMDLEPDYDDMHDLLDWDMEELTGEMKRLGWDAQDLERDLQPGKVIPEDMLDDVRRILDRGEEHEWLLQVYYAGDDQPYLYTTPYVKYPVNDQLLRDFPELYDDRQIEWVEDAVFIKGEQYLCHCSASPSQIPKVWLDQRAMDILGMHPSSASGTQTLTDYANIEGIEDWDGDDPSFLEENAKFREVSVYAFPLGAFAGSHARALLPTAQVHPAARHSPWRPV